MVEAVVDPVVALEQLLELVVVEKVEPEVVVMVELEVQTLVVVEVVVVVDLPLLYLEPEVQD